MSDDRAEIPDFIPPSASPEMAATMVGAEPPPHAADDTARPAGRPRHRRIGLIVGLIVLALVATGVTIVVVRPGAVSATFACDAVSAGDDYSADGVLQAMPVGLTDGLPAPNRVTVAGLWCSVALIDLKSTHLEVLGDGSRTPVDTDVLRAVDVSTGQVLWTMDQAPDGSQLLLQSVLESDGKLALATVRLGGVTDPATEPSFCASGSDVRILNLRTGRTLTSRFSANPACDLGDGDFPVGQFDSVVAYQGGIVVIERNSGPGAFVWQTTSTAGYRDTDLSHALWTVPPGRINVIGLDMMTDRRLPGGWVRADSGDYVSTSTGEVSAGANSGQVASCFAAGDLILEADTVVNPTAAIPNPWFTSVSGWTDLMAAPDWTYTPPTGWVIAENTTLPLGVADDVWIGLVSSATPLVAVTADAIIVMEERFVDLALVEANLTAISQADGRALWRVPYDFAPTDLVIDTSQTTFCPTDDPCSASIGWSEPQIGQSYGQVNPGTLPRAKATVVSSGGQDYLVYATPSAIVSVSAATGQVVGSVAKVNGVATSAVYACGLEMACVAIDGWYAANYSRAGTDIVVVGDLATGPTIVSDAGYALMKTGSLAVGWNDDGLFETGAGLFGVINQHGQYQFLLI